DDSCLRAQFFDASDTDPPNNWSIVIPNDPVLGLVELSFVDAGTRKPGEATAWRHRRDDLGQNWTTLVLCRLKTQTLILPCAAAPRIFDYGLDVTWIEGATEQHASKWRLKLPSNGTHASFDRIHSANATLFKLTTKPHDATSPPPIDATEPLPPVPEPDPLRVVYAGAAVLRCRILPSSDPLSVSSLAAADCEDPLLLRENVSAAHAWCEADLIPHIEETHMGLVSDAVAAWTWSRTCAPLGSTFRTNWTTLFEPNDLADLGEAQTAYANATTDAARAAALADAEAVFGRAASRHVALSVPERGMPVATNGTVVNATLPVVANSLPQPARSATSAVWTGTHAYVFGGQSFVGSAGEQIVRYDPAANQVSLMAATLPSARYGTAAVWTGTHAYVFGGFASFSPGTTIPSNEIVRFDPVAGTAVRVGLLPAALAGASAIWDPRDLPLTGCPGGCAYVFGGDNGNFLAHIFRYNPLTGAATSVGPLPSPRAYTSAVFDGQYAYVFGGTGYVPLPGGGWQSPNIVQLDQIVRYDPHTNETIILPSHLPQGLGWTSAVWDGASAYVFGGHGAGVRAEVSRFDPVTGTVTDSELPLPAPRRETSAVFAAPFAFIFGGRSATTVHGDIVRYTTPVRTGVIRNEIYPNASNFSIIDLAPGAVPPANLRLEAVQILDDDAGLLRTSE
ncbi:MAG: Kelch repeat-containing protein, partial [Methanobacteriota archaeon]